MPEDARGEALSRITAERGDNIPGMRSTGEATPLLVQGRAELP